MVSLEDIVDYCTSRLRHHEVSDYPGAMNGLQVENNGQVTRIGASVDAGLVPFSKAMEQGVDLLLVHHGLFWEPPRPVTGTNYKKLTTLLNNNCALFSSHLPLDCHPEIGNNACIAREMGLDVRDWFLPFENTPIAAIANAGMFRNEFNDRLKQLFPNSYTAIECGPESIARVAICSGSGASAVSQLKKQGVQTLITGELRQHHYNLAEELELNLYPCGHYATETFGVKALAKELGERFGLPWTFLDSPCPL